MAPSKADVQSMVAALFTVNAGLERARRQRKGASTLSLLQLIANGEPVRPSEIADLQVVHPSLITRRVRELEDAGYVGVSTNPKDARSLLVRITPAGIDELDRLTRVGLDRFGGFVAGWDPGEVRMLGSLLTRLHADMAAANERDKLAGGSHRPLRTRDRPSTADRVR
ncbi:MAG: MarR family transcriptional regulator [Candidatus Dormiibacterota bacterium]